MFHTRSKALWVAQRGRYELAASVAGRTSPLVHFLLLVRREILLTASCGQKVVAEEPVVVNEVYRQT